MCKTENYFSSNDIHKFTLNVTDLHYNQVSLNDDDQCCTMNYDLRLCLKRISLKSAFCLNCAKLIKHHRSLVLLSRPHLFGEKRLGVT